MHILDNFSRVDHRQYGDLLCIDLHSLSGCYSPHAWVSSFFLEDVRDAMDHVHNQDNPPRFFLVLLLTSMRPIRPLDLPSPICAFPVEWSPLVTERLFPSYLPRRPPSATLSLSTRLLSNPLVAFAVEVVGWLTAVPRRYLVTMVTGPFPTTGSVDWDSQLSKIASIMPSSFVGLSGTGDLYLGMTSFT